MTRALSLLLSLVTAVAAFTDDDPWAKVRELKGGTQLRIYKVGEKDPIVAKLDRAGEESVIVITKTAQVSIPKEEIERLDVRVAGSRSAAAQTRVDRKVAPKGAEVAGNTIPGATTSVTSGLHRPQGFATIYRRPPAGK